MKRFPVVVVLAFMFSVLLFTQAHSAGIAGQMFFHDRPLEEAEVVIKIFDSVSAQYFGKITTYKSFFNVELKPGTYKIHFSWSAGETCFNEFYNATENGENAFDLGTPITVLADQTSDLGSVNVFSEDKGSPCLAPSCTLKPVELNVMVIDSSTGFGVPGIRVQFKDPVTAFPKFEESPYPIYNYTDEKGGFYLLVKECPEQLDVKIRLSDPQSGIYSPEYFGKTDLDDFSTGERVDFATIGMNAVDSIAKIPPSEQIGGIIDDIINILPPEEAQPVVNSLAQGQALLQDANPNNDQGACGTLNGSGNKLNGFVSNGTLSQADADALAASINTLKNDLGCKK